jgi:hypothetical protein
MVVFLVIRVIFETYGKGDLKNIDFAKRCFYFFNWVFVEKSLAACVPCIRAGESDGYKRFIEGYGSLGGIGIEKSSLQKNLTGSFLVC